MSKRDSEGDVLVNRLNVGLAKHKRLLASWTNYGTDSEPGESELNKKDEEEDLKADAFGPEHLGIGSKIPKDVQDGSFTRRSLTSNDKLLEQMIGKKAAKAHIASKKAPQTAVQPGKFGKQAKNFKREESEDEEDGRAAAFKSKRRKKAKGDATEVAEDADEVHKELVKTTSSAEPDDGEDVTEEVGLGASKEKISTRKAKIAEDDESTSQKQSSKPGSYLDEILAERSKKKKKKSKTKTES